MPAATGTPAITTESSTANRVGKARSIGALSRNHTGMNAAA